MASARTRRRRKPEPGGGDAPITLAPASRSPRSGGKAAQERREQPIYRENCQAAATQAPEPQAPNVFMPARANPDGHEEYTSLWELGGL